MQFRRASKPNVVINIAPLVDVVFLLVIFFAVSTTFLDNAGLKLELPSSSSSSSRELRDLTVLLSSDGTLSFDGQTLQRDQLAESLRSHLAQSEQKTIILKADTNASHGDVVKVMDLIRAAGAEGLHIAARSATE